MGTYLSTPVTEKCEESGESLDCPDVPCAWGVVDMQGWRKGMEDAHVAVTDISLPDCEGKRTSDAKIFAVFDGHGGAEVARFCALYLVSVLTQQDAWREGKLTTMKEDGNKHLDGLAAAETDAGKALRSAFHALDRMVDDVNRREEIAILRNTKPQTGERRDATFIPDPVPMEEGAAELISGETANPAQISTDDNDKISEETAQAKPETSFETPPASMEETREVVDEEPADDDSVEAVGQEEAAAQDRDMMDENDGQESTKEEAAVEDIKVSQSTKVTGMFQRILSLGAQSGQVILKVGGDESSETKETSASLTSPSIVPTAGPHASQPTIVHNGRQICNLPDHAIHAGATAIVAVLTGRVLTVANAGDSRAVMCRANGETLPLSFDHKPQQEVEMSRITKAGGFVNHFGRVNGNLNLSRSLGDLKYKQVPGISPPEQIITAEPDIVQVFVEPKDEFIILGCDGIWDCLSNENAVKYVRERINVKSPAEIGKEMLDEIISEDPRVTQGIGGDNMTIMIIDLQPSTRKWRTEPDPIYEPLEGSDAGEPTLDAPGQPSSEQEAKTE